MSIEQDNVFKALADTSRRTLLDLLFQRDGQTLSELQAHLPMTRFGSMKHLKILEEAGLVSTRKVGREKFHYLNSVPIQLLYDRWVSKYAQPWTKTLTSLKYVLEDTQMTEKPAHVFEIYIRTAPERLWDAITDGTFTQQYYMGSRVESSWQAGASYRYLGPDGASLIAGEVLEVDPPHRLVTTFQPHWVPAELAGQPSKVTWLITATDGVCKLTVTHDDLDTTNPALAGITSGWAQILSGLKTLLETGEPLVIRS